MNSCTSSSTGIASNSDCDVTVSTDSAPSAGGLVISAGDDATDDLSGELAFELTSESVHVIRNATHL